MSNIRVIAMADKSLKEQFANFFEEPTRDKLKKIIQFNLGEEDYLDFKGCWPEGAKIAKHVLAFANSGGGCMVVGCRETRTCTDCRNELENSPITV